MARRQSRTLTDGELRLMNVVWERGQATVQEVVDGLPGEAPLAYNTVLTTMRVLERKGYLRRRKHGRAHVYAPAVTREQARGKALRHVIQSFFDGSPQLLLQSLVQNESLTPAEMEQLKALGEAGDRPQP